jgi:hypothetical protein
LVIGNLFNGVSTAPGGGGEAIEARSWTTFVKEENGESLARIIKLVSFELAPTMPFGGGAGAGCGGGLERSSERKEWKDITAEPFEITRASKKPYTVNIRISLFDGSDFKVSHFLCLYNSGSWSDRKESTLDDTFPVTQYLLCHAPPTTATSAPPPAPTGVSRGLAC